jgi:hypothetical protein
VIGIFLFKYLLNFDKNFKLKNSPIDKSKSNFKTLKSPFPRILIARREGKVVKIAKYIFFGFQILANNMEKWFKFF